MRYNLVLNARGRQIYKHFVFSSGVSIDWTGVRAFEIKITNILFSQVEFPLIEWAGGRAFEINFS